MNKKEKIAIAVVAILLVSIVVIFFKVKSNKYKLGDYGVVITAPSSYSKKELLSKSNILRLENEKEGIVISATSFPKNYWDSKKMPEITDEYIRLISMANFDKSISEVSKTELFINMIEIGKVSLTLKGDEKITKTISLILHENEGNLAIEIYGKPEAIDSNIDEINKIIGSLRYTGNKHDYSNFTVLSGDSGD